MRQSCVAASVCLVASAFWGMASADTPSTAANQPTETHAQNQKLVYRLISVTFGADAFCKAASPEAWPDFKIQLDRFSARYPELMKTLRDSPYYAQAQRQLSLKTLEMAARETSETATAECRGFAKLLEAMIDDPAGQKAMLGYEAQLAPRS